MNNKYNHSPFPLGVTGTFLILFIPTLIIILAWIKSMGPRDPSDALPFLLIPIVLLIVILPSLYNLIASPFEKARKVIASFTGGGSLSLFHGTWPMFRLLIYEDGLEIRVFLHCFFIPYDKMDYPFEKISFSSTRLLIESDLPEVPSQIRFAVFRMKPIIALVEEHRNRYLAGKRNDAS